MVDAESSTFASTWFLRIFLLFQNIKVQKVIVKSADYISHSIQSFNFALVDGKKFSHLKLFNFLMRKRLAWNESVIVENIDD